MATYRVDLRDLYSSGHTLRASDLGFADFSYRRVLNGPGAFEGTIAIANAPATYLTAGNREILVYRDGVQVWGGYLDQVEVDTDARTIRVGGEGYWSRMRRRLIRGSVVFRDTTASAIAQALISTATGTQGLSNGNLGILAGTHTGTTKAITKRVYCGGDLRFIADVVERFAENGNLDFEITPSQATGRAGYLNTWGPRRGTDRSASVALTSSNTMSLSYSISASDLITSAVVYSSNQCDMSWEPYTATRNAATYGVMDAGIVIEEKEQSEASEQATEILRVQSAPIWSADVQYLEGTGPAITAYDLGDTIAITPGDGYTTGSKSLVVMEREISVGPGGAVVNLTLEERQA